MSAENCIDTTRCPCPCLPKVTLEQAVVDLVESIALQENALSHILCAESRKMDAAMKLDGLDLCKLLEVNDSATNMVHAVANLELGQSFIRRAKELGLAAILRVFLLDSISLESLGKMPANLPDSLDIQPGTMPKILRRVCADAKVPVLTGGLIADKEDVMAALDAGATAISTTNQAVWNM